MLLTRLLGREPRLASDDALRALAALDWTGRAGRPGLVAYFPVVRGNPFQALLYSRLPEVGLRAVPTYDVEQTATLVDAVAGSVATAVHVHWLNVVTAKSADEAEAKERAEEFLARLRAVRDAGARLAWTVHNILPHESRFPEVEAALRAGVVEVVEKVHVMSPRTRELVAPWFDVPVEKVLAVPHPTYDDVYPAWMTPQQARQELGITPDACVFLLVGRIQPYKGLDELAAAFDTLSAREPGRHVLLVAGPPNREAETQRFREWASGHPAVVAALRKIPDEEMQVYLRAADVAVFPYRRSLNSGALALTLTFGLPVVITGASGETTTVDPAFAEVYDPAAPEGLVDALAAAATRLRTATARAAAVEAARPLAAPSVARGFAAVVRDWLDRPDAQEQA